MANAERLRELITWGQGFTKTGSDDDTSWTEFSDFSDSVKEELGSWDESDPEYDYVKKLKEDYEKMSYTFSLNPVNVAVYAVNIVSDLSCLLFRAFGLMIENMRSTPSYNENTSDGFTHEYSEGPDYSYSKENGKSKRKARTKRKEKLAEKSGSEKTEKAISERQSEKTARQERARRIVEESKAVERYEKKRRERALETPVLSHEMVNERAFSRY